MNVFLSFVCCCCFVSVIAVIPSFCLKSKLLDATQSDTNVCLAYRLPWCAWIIIIDSSSCETLYLNYHLIEISAIQHVCFSFRVVCKPDGFCVKHVIIRWDFCLANAMYVHKFMIFGLFPMQLHSYTRIAITLKYAVVLVPFVFLSLFPLLCLVKAS